jgi:O-antigen/teichoic acid export membrane protein
MNVQAIRHIVMRLAVMVGGEAMQSAFHLGLNIALLHSVSTRDYGIFALVMVAGGLGLTYIRALTALPASIAIAQSRRLGAAGAYEVTFGSAAMLLSLLLGLTVTGVLSVWLDEGALFGGAFIGLWATRAHVRTVFFARGRQMLVSASDLAFTLSGAAGTTWVIWSGTHILHHIFIVMAAANALGIAMLLVLGRGAIRPSLGRHVWRRYRRLWRDLKWSVLSVTITNLQGQGMALMVAAMAGPAAYAPIAAALVNFAPFRIISAAFANMMHPELSTLMAHRSFAGVGRRLRRWPLPLAGFAILYGAAILVALPFITPGNIEGDSFHQISILAWVMSSLPMLYVMPRIWLEIAQDYRSIAILSAIAAAAGLLLVFVLLLAVSPSWALLGGALSEIIVLIGSWAIVRPRQRAAEEASQAR